MSAKTTLILLTVSIALSDAAKILAFIPIPSISYQVLFRPLTQELAKRGHEVTVITPDPAFKNGGAPANVTEIDVHDFAYKKWKTFYELSSSGDDDLVLQMRLVYYLIAEIVEMQLKVDKVEKLLKEETFDLLLLEACARPALLVSHVFKVALILVSSFGPLNINVQNIGASWHPLLYPDAFGQRLYNLTKFEKVSESVKDYRISKLMKEIEDRGNKIGKRIFGPNIPAISKLKNNVDMLFLNTYPIWEGNRPVPPSVVYMGGLHQKPVQELPKESKIFLLGFEKDRRKKIAEMIMLRWMCVVTRLDKVRNEYISGSLKVALVTEKLKKDRLP